MLLRDEGFRRLCRARDLLRELREPAPSIADLAREVQISPFHFIRQFEAVTRERVRNHEKWFEAFAERGRVVELSGTHDLIVTNPRDVLQQIEAFVSSLPERP